MKRFLLSLAASIAMSCPVWAADCPAPAEDLPALVRMPLLENCDIAAAYQAARISLARGQEASALLWLEYLSASGWQLGMESGSPLADTLNRSPRPMGESKVRYMLGARDFFAEGIAADAGSGRLFIGSLTKNAVMVVGDDVGQKIWPLPEAGPLSAVYGMKFDADSGELWLLRNRADMAAESAPLPQAELMVLDGRTGAVKRTASPPTGSLAELNDLCSTPDGAYVTDSRNHAVYHVDRETLTFTTLPLPDIRYPNGIACHGDTAYIADWRGITRLRLGSGEASRLQPPGGETLGGIDGLVLHGNTLVGIQNGFRFARVIRISLDGKTLETLDIGHPAYAIPTTGVVVDGAFVYIANSQMDRIAESADARASLRPLTLLTLPLK